MDYKRSICKSTKVSNTKSKGIHAYQLAAFGEPFTEQRMCIHFNKLRLWVSEWEKMVGKFRYLHLLVFIDKYD